VELESTYLGEGWFRYRLRSIDDPFFLYFNMTFLTAAFPKFSEFTSVSNGWSSLHYTNHTGPRVGWEYSYDWPGQSRPYERVFFARTEHRSFKRGPYAQIGMSLSFLGGYHGYLATHNIVGFMPLHALVPCPPDEADGSPTNLLERFTVIDLPEIRIDDLVRSGSNIIGFSFTYPEESTVLLQGSRDFQTWTNVGYVYGNAGTTTFQSGTVLNPYGNFFRVLLAAEGHASLLTNAAGTRLSKSVAPKRSSETTEARVVTCIPGNVGVTVTVRTKPGHRYAVLLLSADSKSYASRVIAGQDAVADLLFPEPLPNPVLAVINAVD
jgi:hypothetical protein